jgi:hypothetical protein
MRHLNTKHPHEISLDLIEEEEKEFRGQEVANYENIYATSFHDEY